MHSLGKAMIRHKLLAMAHLTVRIKGVDGHYKAKLNKDRIVLGRSTKCDVLIEDVDGVSREHCVFIRDGERWFLEDMGTTNGTKLNKDRIEGRVELHERDVVKVSKVRLTVHISSESQKSQSSAGAPEQIIGANDPKEAIQCSSCDTWVSVAHRLPAEQMVCPRCNTLLSVPMLVAAGAAETAEVTTE